MQKEEDLKKEELEAAQKMIETIQEIEEQHVQEYRDKIRKRYKGSIKKNCRKCHGTGSEYIYREEINGLIYPKVCDCIVKKQNKYHLELLANILIEDKAVQDMVEDEIGQTDPVDIAAEVFQESSIEGSGV